MSGAGYVLNNNAEIFNDYREYVSGEKGNSATGSYSHAEGTRNVASGDASHAEGRSTTASGS